MSEDGQPDEAKEWEDFEGPQDIYQTCLQCGYDLPFHHPNCPEFKK